MIYYFEFDEIEKLYIRKKLGEEELNNNKCFTIDGSGDSFKVIVYCNVELALKPNTIVLLELALTKLDDLSREKIEEAKKENIANYNTHITSQTHL